MSIKLLAPQLANQIAAGEVVERPASVVKELIENSIDAGASRIDVDIERGGHKRIRLRDNGKGIAKDELELALSRHATSKISNLDDLESILSLGFRGEALASISSVSRLTLTSRPREQSEAWQAHCEGREMQVKLNPAAHPDGTTIDVADLFYNTPARRKFLRTEKTEFQHIEDVFKRIALSHPSITLNLTHNDKPVRRFPAVAQDNRSRRIAAVVGKKFIDNAIYTQVDYEGITLEAWLGNEQVLRSSSDCQFSFVNGRGMRDKLILHAIRQAYESAWGVIEQPAFVVFLSVSPRDVDVNVHPAKHEVRFQQSRLVHDFICKSVLDALIDTQGELGAGPVIQDQPGHDYIRPLQSHTPTSAPYVTESARGGEASVSPSRPATSGPSARAGNRANPQSAANYQTLMTPATPETDFQASAATDYVIIDEQHRLYVKDDSLYLVSVQAMASYYLNSLFRQAGTSQPLLMPVALEDTGADDTLLQTLQSQHFQVQRMAGKLRLQQVPAGTRHLPWSSWFALLLEGAESSSELNVSGLAGHLPQSLYENVWAYLAAQSTDQQWEWISDSGKVRELSALLGLFK
ncbi:DNA mismatch repair endonuclease MutL [Alteromonas halophila]|uniref:DNA mismatch repair protein MutL n=1 Tax=Alteromonas halophila TaxID=516698 RepID=A0A918MY42_9ALTE|nr:DNA mismatch repair endonuclease MutL [Alteromonas halophila]GGW83560.1 DNA mismatch repair protein MutL [Alteromonas halophila]